jgi:hypothetical protein
MRKTLITMIVVIALCHSALAIFGIMRFRIAINHQYIKLYRYVDGYSAWTVSYSDGRTFDGETWRTLWRKPCFHRVRVRELNRGV